MKVKNSHIAFKFKYEVRKHKTDTSFRTEKGTRNVVVDTKQEIHTPIDLKDLNVLKDVATRRFEQSLYSNDMLVDLSVKSIKIY